MQQNRLYTILKISAGLLLIAGITAAGHFMLKRYVDRKLSAGINPEKSVPFRVEYENREIRVFPFSLKITGLSILSDTASHTSPGDSPEGYSEYRIYCREISLRGISLFSFLKDKSMTAKSITVKEPEVEISGTKWLSGRTEKDYEQIINDLQPLVMSTFSYLSVGKISLDDANFRFYGSLSDTSHIAGARRISVEILNFRTTTSIQQETASWFQTDDVRMRINNFNHVMADAVHLLQIDSITYSLKNNGIHASGFFLHPARPDPEKNLYEVRVPSLFIRSSDLAGFTFRDEINISYLSFDKPEIRFFRNQSPKRIDPEDVNNFNLYSLIEDQFTRIEIDSFRLTDASLKIYQLPEKQNFQQQFDSIDITLNGFALDSTSSRNPEKLLHADNLEMTVSGYQLHLNDNAHDFTADSLFISTFTQSMGAKQIRIFPVQNDKIDTRARVNISCEAAEIGQADLRKLYHTRRLPTQKISILKPSVALEYHHQIHKSKKQGDAGLFFDLVSAYLKGVYADTVTVSNGDLSIKNLKNRKILGYFDTGFNFDLKGFSLDSASLSNTDRFFYAKNFHLSFDNYQMQLVDDLHRLSVGQVIVSSEQQKLDIENLNLEPIRKDVTDSIMNHFNRSELYHIRVPRISLAGVDLREAFFYNQLKIKNFLINEPDIHLENFGHLKDTMNKKELNDLYSLVFNYISDISVDRAAIPGGKLIWINHTRKGKTTTFDNAFSASLENFRLNRSELDKQRLFFSDNFDITLKDQLFQLSDSVHMLKAGQISLSTKNASVLLENALLYPLITAPRYNSLSTTFQISIPRLQISNIDFLRAFYSRELVLDRLDISQAGFRIYSKSGKIKSLDLNRFKIPLPSFVASLKVKDFSINRGEFMLYETTPTNNIPKSNFLLDLEIPGMLIRRHTGNQAKVESDNLTLTIYDLQTPLGKWHNLKIGRVNFNRTARHIAVNNLYVIPHPGDFPGYRFSIFAPEMDFTRFDISKVWENNHFGFDNIIIRQPEMDIRLQQKSTADQTKSFRATDLYPWVEPYVDEVRVKRIELKDAQVKLSGWSDKILENRLNVHFDDVWIAENIPARSFLNAREFEVSTTNLSTRDKKNRYEFFADSLVYNSSKHRIRLANAGIKPLYAPDDLPRITGYQTDYFKGAVKTIELLGFDEERWLNEKVVSARLLKTGNGNLYVYRNKRYPFNTQQRPPWPRELISSIKQPFILDSVSITPVDIRYSELTTISDTAGYVDFDRFTLNMGAVSNIPRQNYGKYHPIRMEATADLYGKAQVSLVAEFYSGNPGLDHHLTGSIGTAELTLINPMLKRSAPLTVESGKMQKLGFSLYVTDSIATGELTLEYDNLAVSVMEFSEEGAKKAKLATFLTNKLLLNSKNPKGNTLIPEKIRHPRDPERSLLNYWWKALFSGVKNTIGIKNEEKPQE